MASEAAAGIDRRGIMLVLSSPSGAGKTTLCRDLQTQDRAFTLSISVTTRPRRHSEADGVHYHFIDEKTFIRMRDEGALLEWAQVHDHYYATPREPVEQALAGGRDVLFDIDWQGTQQIREALPDDLVSVFVLPPSLAELRARLERRAEDGSDVIERRLANGRVEIEHWLEYDYVIVNYDVGDALKELTAIVAAERLRRSRQVGLADFVAGLLVEDQS